MFRFYFFIIRKKNISLIFICCNNMKRIKKIYIPSSELCSLMQIFLLNWIKRNNIWILKIMLELFFSAKIVFIVSYQAFSNTQFRATYFNILLIARKKKTFYHMKINRIFLNKINNHIRIKENSVNILHFILHHL